MSSPEQVLLYAALEGSVSPRNWNALVETSEEAPVLHGIDLAGYDLRGLSFENCDLSGATLESCRAEGVSFEGAALSGVSFQGARLSRANFRKAQGVNADFSGAELTDADLSWCSFRDSNFAGVDLRQVGLWKTDLRGAHYARFEPTSTQDFLEDSAVSGDCPVPLSEVLQRVGSLTGQSYHIDKGLDMPQVLMPEDLEEDPVGRLTQLLASIRLVAEPVTGEHGTQHWDVVAKYRVADA